MKAGVQPRLQAGFGPRKMNIGYADGSKTQFAGPGPDFFDERGAFMAARLPSREFLMIDFTHGPDDSDPDLRAHLADEADTLAAGAKLAPALTSGLVIYLDGDLGAGKTTLVRGLLRALGHSGSVKSPTYTLIEPYVVSRLNLYHFDFYRFTSPEEYLEAGLEEYFTDQGVCLVEWPQKAQPYVAAPDVVIELAVAGDGRDMVIRPQTELGRQCTEKLAAPPPPR